jgi:AMMECR1 domain-containing protein
LIALALPVLALLSADSPLPLARAALERAVAGAPALEAAGGEPTALFLTVVLDGRTRACQGSLAPTSPSLAGEIETMARRASQGDARHPPLTRRDVERAKIVLSFPEPPRQWTGAAVDPRRFGLVVETARGAGVLLPGEARTFEWMLAEAKRRAGASQEDPGTVRVFRTRTVGDALIPAIEDVSP